MLLSSTPRHIIPFGRQSPPTEGDWEKSIMPPTDFCNSHHRLDSLGDRYFCRLSGSHLPAAPGACGGSSWSGPASSIDLGALLTGRRSGHAAVDRRHSQGNADKKDGLAGRGVIATITQANRSSRTASRSRARAAVLPRSSHCGMRAVAVRVNDIVGVAGFVIPGRGSTF